METGKMRKDELTLLHYAIGHHFPYAEGFDMAHKINFGAVFAQVLENAKFRVMTPIRNQRTENLGGLLYPIFRSLHIQTSDQEVPYPARSYIGEGFMKAGSQLRGKWGHFEVLYTECGVKKAIIVPNDLFRIDSAKALEFAPLAGDSSVIGADSRRLGQAPHAAGPSHAPADETPSYELGEFVPAPSYADEDFKPWLEDTLKSIWNFLKNAPRCCTRQDDVIPPRRVSPPHHASPRPPSSPHDDIVPDSEEE